MTNNPFLKLSPSMEDNDLNVTINAEHEGDESNDEIESLDTSDTPEAAELDLNDASEEVGEEITATEEADEAVEALENIYVALEQISASGETLSASGVALLKVAVNNATKKIPGLNYETMNMPSMESFESSPYSSLNVSMEGVGEMLQKGYNALIEFFKTIGEKFTHLFKILFDNVYASKNKVTKIKKRAEATTDKNNGGKVKVPANFSGNTSGIIAKDLDTYVTMYETANARLDKVFDSKEHIDFSANSEDVLRFFDSNGSTALHSVTSSNGAPALETKKQETKEIDAISIAEVKTATSKMLTVIDKFDNVAKRANSKRNKYLKDTYNTLVKDSKSGDKAEYEKMKSRRSAALIVMKWENSLIRGTISYINQAANILDKCITVRGGGKDGAKADKSKDQTETGLVVA